MLNQGIFKKYQGRLSSIPAPGGNGCHPTLLAVANLGVLARLSAERIFQDIRDNIPPGQRWVHNSEIRDAINKALSDRNGGTCIRQSRPEPIVNNGKTVLQKIINQGKIGDDVGLWEASPTYLWNEPQGDPALLLSTLYESDDLIWIGERYQAGIVGDTIRTAREWIAYFQNGGTAGPHIIPNPMSGLEGLTKDGKPSFRCDNTIRTYRYGIVEFDNLSREAQIRFWSAVKMPIYALIDSAGKSVHAWLDIQKLVKVETFEQWMTEIKGHLYDQILTPMGVDSQCSNPARLSRLPGHFRSEKGAWQRLLWLSPEGRPVCP